MPRCAGTWLKDPRGHPSRWVALGLACMFGGGAVAAALMGEGYHVTGILGGLFIVCFNASFGRRPVAAQVASAFARRTGGNRSGAAPP